MWNDLRRRRFMLKKMRSKRNLLLLLGMLAMAGAVPQAAAQTAVETQAATLNGWQKKGGYTYYYRDGQMLKGLRTIDGKKYYFDKQGRMLISKMQSTGGIMYYFTSNGTMYTGMQKFISYKGHFYWMNEKHQAVIKEKWQTINGNKYFLTKYGTPYKGYRKIGKCYYYFDSQGRMQADKIVTVDGKKYYLRPDGKRYAINNVAFEIDGKYYWVNSDYTLKELAGVPATISNTDSQYTIEADVTLTGTGTGYHAKLVAATAVSAVSFGIQYDQWGVAPYTDKTVFLIENVATNNAGGQAYVRTGLCSRGVTYHLMMTVQKNGRCDVYVNGEKVGSVNNSGLANQTVYLRVEGSGRKNGDSVNAIFSNIEVKGSGSYQPSKKWGTHNFDVNAGIHSDASAYSTLKKVVIQGTVQGLTDAQDWDNAYDKVSGTIQFVE